MSDNMEKRKEQLLRLIMEKYIGTAEPVGSEFLVTEGKLELSPATVRNEMREMEEQGILTHPHTSAGRIPTAAGIKYYVENLLKPEAIKRKTAEEIKEIVLSGDSQDKKIKSASKYIAAYVNNAVIVAMGSDKIYYTGLSGLFSQPEFRDFSHTVNMGEIFDSCEIHLGEIAGLVGEDVKIFIGQENPLGESCGTVAAQIGKHNLLAIVGPTRMDYNKSLGILEFFKNIF